MALFSKPKKKTAEEIRKELEKAEQEELAEKLKKEEELAKIKAKKQKEKEQLDESELIENFDDDNDSFGDTSKSNEVLINLIYANYEKEGLESTLNLLDGLKNNILTQLIEQQNQTDNIETKDNRDDDEIEFPEQD